MKILRLNTFNLLVLGICVFFGGTLFAVAGAGTLAWLLIRFVAAVLFFFAAFIGFSRGQMRPQGRVYYKAFLCLLFYLTLMTLPNLAGTWGYMGYRAALAGDVITYGLFAFGLALFALSGKQMVALFKIFTAFCLGLFVLLLPFLDPSAVAAAGSRSEALDIAGLGDSRHVYHFQMGMAAIFPYLLLSNFALPLKPLWRLALYITPAFVLLVALYYSKRAVILDLAVTMTLLSCVIVLFSTYFAGIKKFRAIFISVAIAIVLTISAFLFGKHLDVVITRLTDRLDQLTYSLADTDRIIESQYYWARLPTRMKFTGAGSMYFHTSLRAEPSATLHIGWMNLYHKGGPPLVLFVMYILMKNFLTSIRYRKNPSFAVGATLPVLLAISLAHSTIFGSLHGTFAFTLALFLYPALLSFEQKNRWRAEVGAGNNRDAPKGMWH